jgi:hypothetical protein
MLVEKYNRRTFTAAIERNLGEGGEMSSDDR